MKHRRSINPFPRILSAMVAAVVFAFGFAVLTAGPAQAAVIEVADPVAGGFFDVPSCDDLNGDRHQPEASAGYRYDKDVTDTTVTLKAVPLAEGDVVYAPSDDDATWTYDVPQDCPEVPVKDDAADRSVDPERGALPNTGAADDTAHDAAAGMAYGAVILLAGLAIYAATGKPRGRHRV